MCLLLLFHFPDIYVHVNHVCFHSSVDILLVILRYDLFYIRFSVTQ
jgi:hypothetical protein